jgi:hypothetical protein
MNVKPLRDIKKPPRTIPEPLPDPRAEQPFLWLISAKVASGKSVLISNLLARPWGYKQYFDRVYFCSSNVADGKVYDVAYSTLHLNKDRIYDDFNAQIFDEIVQDIREDDDTDAHYLLVIDDLPTELNKRSSRIVKHLLKHRHLRLSIICVTQKLNLLNLSIRSNASHVCVFRTMNRNERDSLATLTDLDEKVFLEILDEATEEKHAFLFMVLNRNPLQLYKNLTERIL